MGKGRDVSGIEPSFTIRIKSSNSGDWQGEIEDMGLGYKKEFQDVLELTNIMEKWIMKINNPLSMKNARSWYRDEGSVDKQGEQIFRFMRRLKPFENG